MWPLQAIECIANLIALVFFSPELQHGWWRLVEQSNIKELTKPLHCRYDMMSLLYFWCWYCPDCAWQMSPISCWLLTLIYYFLVSLCHSLFKQLFNKNCLRKWQIPVVECQLFAVETPKCGILITLKWRWLIKSDNWIVYSILMDAFTKTF